MSGENPNARDAMRRMGDYLHSQGVPADRIEKITRGAAERADDRAAGQAPRPVTPPPRKG